MKEDRAPIPLNVKGLQVRYGRNHVIQGLDLSLSTGQLTGIMGPNGAGKTTLLLALSGFLRSQGRIELFGRELKMISSGDRAQLLALLPQNLDTPFLFTVEEIVRMGRYCRKESEATKRQMALKALDRCGMLDLKDRSFMNLSGGERQLALLARCLCQDSPIFLLDEATSSLDLKRKIQVFEILRREVEQKKRTILTVIHDINLACLYLDRLIFMKQGAIVVDGPVQKTVTEKVLRDVFDTDTISVTRHPKLDRPVVIFSRPETNSLYLRR